MAVTTPALTAALQSIGSGHVYVGTPFVADGLAPLGAKHGEVRVEITEDVSDLTAEQTGPAVHQRTVMGLSARVTVPIILGDTALYAKISPTGTRGGGWSVPQPVVTTSVLLIPNLEVGGGLTNATGATTGWTRAEGNGAAAASGAGAAPVHAVWLWRAVPERGGWGFSYDDGGRTIVEVTFQAMFYAANPEGHKMFTIGDPTAQGITTIRL